MYEINKVGDKTYYLECPSKIGIYKITENDVYLIDSGNDAEAGRKVRKVLEENNWNLKGIINTHSNADHIGGNKYLQNRYNCEIISTDLENAFAAFPILESSFLYGGYPCNSLQNKFLMAEKSNPTGNMNNLPDGLEYISLKGHFFDMIGIKTSDDVYFLADSLFSENIINKYHFFFIYDVGQYLNTLDMLETLQAKTFIPSHAPATNDIKPLIKINRENIEEIANLILYICEKKNTFEDILKELNDHYNLTLNIEQYVLVGSTVKSYLSYLYNNNKIAYEFIDNKMYWKKKDE